MPAMRQRIDPRSLEPEPRITLHGVSWDQYEALLGIRGESSGVRLTYLDGELELMSPSRPHEGIKKCIARLLETWALERGIDLDGFGSWTIRAQRARRGHLEVGAGYQDRRHGIGRIVMNEGSGDSPRSLHPEISNREGY